MRARIASIVAVLAAVFPAPAHAQEHVCFGEPATIVGREGAVEFGVPVGRRVIVALGGTDVVSTGGATDSESPADDLVCSGEGDDIVSDGYGDDRVTGGPGNDKIDHDPGDDVIQGGP